MIELYVRKRELHGVSLWWVCRKVVDTSAPKGPRVAYAPYSDVHAPTGYGYKSKARAEQAARNIENMLNMQGGAA